MCRGHDAHVDLERSLAAEALDPLVLEDAQELGLERRRHVADLVQEQGAAVGDLELAAAGRSRAGEGPALVAEQLALEQRLRDGGAMDRDEWSVRARASGVDGARQPFLANARLAQDDQRAVRRCDPSRRAIELAHRAQSLELREAVAVAVLPHAEPLLHGLAPAVEEGIHRFREELVGQREVDHALAAGHEQGGALARVLLVREDHHVGLFGQARRLVRRSAGYPAERSPLDEDEVAAGS